MYRKKDSNLAIVLGGLFIALLIVVFAAACNVEDDSPTVYYPHTSQYGYYDSQHHWHYHKQYAPKPAYKAPAPKPGPKVSTPKNSGSGFSFNKGGSSSSRRR